MRCHECGGKYRVINSDLQIDDPYVGPYVVEAVSYYRCDGCGQLLFPPKTAEAAEKRRRERRDELLKERPLRTFLTAAETASTLGISRQALHKHRRIRRGFIYQTGFCGGIIYLEESVKLFKATGDGRFPLCHSTEPSGGEYLGPTESSRLLTQYVLWPDNTAKHIAVTFKHSHQTTPITEVYSGVR
jgi:hypothetical protein